LSQLLPKVTVTHILQTFKVQCVRLAAGRRTEVVLLSAVAFKH